MKKYIVLAILTVSFLACKGTKKATTVNKNGSSVSAVSNDGNRNEKEVAQSKSKTKQPTSTQSKKKDAANAETTNTPSTNAAGNMVSQTNGSTGAMDDSQMAPSVSSAVSEKDLDKMYKDLQMTDSQIFTFNNAMREYKQAVKSNAHGEMLGTEGNEQERQLKVILTSNQWNKYQTWKKKRK